MPPEVGSGCCVRAITICQEKDSILKLHPPVQMRPSHYTNTAEQGLNKDSLDW